MHILDVAVPALIYQYRNDFNAEEWLTFQEQFSSEKDAISYLFHSKWPDGFRCPRCEHHHAYMITTRNLPLYQCRNCHHQTSLTVDTIMENTRTPLLKWLIAIFLVSRTGCGINAKQLQERIKVTYKTSWTMLHVIRRAISKADSEQSLTGTVRGGVGFCSQLPYSSTTELQPQEKPVLIGATLDERKQPAIIKMKLVDSKHMRTKHLTSTSIQDFTEKHIDVGVVDVQLLQRFAFVKYNSIKNLFIYTAFHLKRTFKGLTSRYLQHYLDEACFRINQSLHNKPAFENLSRLCMSTNRHLSISVRQHRLLC